MDNIQNESQPERTDPATVSFLLSLANDMRIAKGDKVLDDLPQSEPQNPYSCVIANAFNYGCQVSPSSSWGWPDVNDENDNNWAGCISFQNEEDRATYLKIVDEKFDNPDWEFHYSAFDAPLTKELNDIAIAFDEGKAFAEYSEYWTINEYGHVVVRQND